METNQLTYPERDGKMSKRARQSACAEAGRNWTRAQHAAGNIGELEILVVNQLRLAGENLNRAANKSNEDANEGHSPIGICKSDWRGNKNPNPICP